jgi:hypothetical protein
MKKASDFGGALGEQGGECGVKLYANIISEQFVQHFTFCRCSAQPSSGLTTTKKRD